MLNLLLACAPAAVPPTLAEACEPDPVAPIDGREIFLRSWTPGDLRAAGGDGLGPGFNDVSCDASQSLVGPGVSCCRDHNVALGPTLTAMPTLLSTRAVGFFRPERNTPALFGAGLVDTVGDDALIEAAAT